MANGVWRCQNLSIRNECNLTLLRSTLGWYFAKVTPPRFAADIHDELVGFRQLSLPLRVIPLGRGFFTLILSSMDDYAKAKLNSSLKLRHGLLSIKDWSPKFDPYKQNSSLVQVWTRIYYLPHDFWHPKFLTGIAHAIGTPIKMDGPTFNRDVRHFARILIEIDISQELIYTIPISRGADCFDIKFSEENLPYFCGICHMVGHSVTHCRRRPKVDNAAESPPESADKSNDKGDDSTLVNRSKKNNSQAWESTGQSRDHAHGTDHLAKGDHQQTSGGHIAGGLGEEGNSMSRPDILESILRKAPVGWEQPTGNNASSSASVISDAIASRNSFGVLEDITEGDVADNATEANQAQKVVIDSHDSSFNSGTLIQEFSQTLGVLPASDLAIAPLTTTSCSESKFGTPNGVAKGSSSNATVVDAQCES
ncbi:uncharacterized protein LOC131004574 [Salvia miltiorrhiza]|uniref:uncharacterized protein LOC131004574 n=1 Tax=Salvia miltiorrhiza TaxID=226208 RepID=UPI0025AD3CCB|nr:uncharacterized protein LOC131004574 [Salvia miltiorrhiza]